jgi:dipeptidyl aminopeptidase/acylaminoacyl peptidase
VQNEEDKTSLKQWRLGRGWMTLHSDPEGVADVDHLLWSRTRDTWVGIAYYGAHRRWYGQRAEDQSVLKAIARQLPTANLDLSSAANGRLWLIRARQSNWAVDRHFLYYPEGDHLEALLVDEGGPERVPPPVLLPEAKPVSWLASDGMRLHGYVYLPRGRPPGDVPLIAWLHGGPIARNTDSYHPAIQLLTNRGYAVFLPDFRASSGYGLAYMRAAEGDVGNGRVLADVIDGMDAMLARGIGDPQRQAVMGHSFGGYASLLAVTHFPDRFQFAFAAAPPTDYGWAKVWQVAHDGPELSGKGPPVGLRFLQFGFSYTDPAWLARMQRESPMVRVEQVRVPVYLWAGTEDRRVPLKSVVTYATAARAAGKSINLLVDPRAGHIPSDPLGTEAWLFMLEAAAHAHFGGGVTPPSGELAAFLERNWRLGSVPSTAFP